jgi:hypothetical protein
MAPRETISAQRSILQSTPAKSAPLHLLHYIEPFTIEFVARIATPDCQLGVNAEEDGTGQKLKQMIETD